MPGRDLTFIQYIVDTPTGLCYYKDAGGNVQKRAIDKTFPVNMRRASDGWMNRELAFTRNMQKYGGGLFRSGAVPEKLIDDAAFIVRTLMNTGRGIGVPLTMLIYKYNGNPEPGDPIYDLYYRGQIDLPKSKNIWAEGLQVNLMEGGFMQLLKAKENTMYEIPCDGSIPENIKANMDGMLFEDTFNYSIIGINGPSAGAATLPCSFLTNEGDSAGIVHGDPTYETVVASPSPAQFYQQSQNSLYISGLPIKVRIKGTITFSSSVTSRNISFGLFLATSKTVAATPPTPGLTHTTSLVDPQLVQGQQIFAFDKTVTLDANERLFLMMETLNGTDSNWSIIGGNFTMTFASQFPATYPWGMTLFDLGKLLIEKICEDASVNGQTYNYAFQSQLLEDNLNLVATCGDALRASGDSNYQRFYNAVVNNPNFPNTGVSYYYGPVLKTSLSDFFQSVNALLNASMSTRFVQGQGDTIFIEKKGYVFNASVKNLDNGEVTEVADEPATDLMFTLVKIGYEPQTYDQKAGKYAWNTTLELVSPLTTIPSKTLEIISKYITDPYLMEKLRSDTGGTSTTRNNSDNAVFVANTDPSNFVFDKFSARFDSAVPSVGGNPNADGNTNIHLLTRQWLQSVNMPAIQGSYLSYSNVPAIFLFNQSTLAGGAFNLSLDITGNFTGYPANALTGQPADQTTIKLWINGVLFQSWTITASAVSTPIAINLATTHNFSFKDSIYLTCDTSVNGTTFLESCQLTLTTAGPTPYHTAVGSSIQVDPGATSSLIAMPTNTPTLDGAGRPKMSYGFQYFQFNSVLLNPNFDITFLLNAVMQGGTTGQRTGFDFYINGTPAYSQIFTRDAAQLFQGFGLVPGFGAPTINRDFQLGDIVFMVVSAEDTNVTIENAVIQLMSTQIKAYNLKRVQYDAIYGIPTLLGNLPNSPIPITTGPGAPYNIEDLTPARLARKHGNHLRSILWDQIPGALVFSQLSKNQYLRTQRGSEIVVENADIQISDLDKQLFKAKYITYKTRVQETFARIQTGAANAYVGATYNGLPVDCFPVDMKQKAALNEMQEWKMLAGPDFDFTQLNNIGFDAQKPLDMKPNSLYCSFLSPVQFVPEGMVLPQKYHTYNRNYFWYKEQVSRWINQNNYWQPWQTTDVCSLQFITRDLSALEIRVYDCAGADPLTVVNAAQKATNGLPPGHYCWEVTVDLSAYAGKLIYLVAVAGSGFNTVSFISEGMKVQVDWPDTLLLEYTHSSNKPSMMFDTGYSPAMRIRGFFDNQFEQDYKGSFYVDQPQDIKIINAIPYETTTLWSGLDDGEPDWVHKKVARILLLDGAMIDGEGFSLDDGAKWEKTFIEGSPKRYHKIAIRPSRSLDGISMDIGGFVEDAAMATTLDAQYMGPNAGNMGSAQPIITEVTITT